MREHVNHKISGDTIMTERANGIEISVILPMFNEEPNVTTTVEKIQEVLKLSSDSWEMLIINDGSTDRTLEIADAIAQKEARVKVISHHANMGRGRALRTGFANAKGEVIITIDADLSYDAGHISGLLEEIKKDKLTDIVVGSPYMSGGKTINVPFHRLLLSRIGNSILRFALSSDLHTFTGILRAYRKEVLDSITLESTGKEIHLEILSKALALGYNIKEIPGTLTGRRTGKSKFKFRSTVVSHLLFSFYEKPALIFGFLGTVMLIFGVGIGVYLIVLWQKGTLTANRPLFILLMLLILGGILILAFGFIGTQLAILRKEIYKLQRKGKQGNRR